MQPAAHRTDSAAETGSKCASHPNPGSWHALTLLVGGAACLKTIRGSCESAGEGVSP